MILRTAAAFRRGPIDVVHRAFDIATFAVNAIGVIDMQILFTWLSRIINHLVDRRWAKMIAGRVILRMTYFTTDIRVRNVQMIW